MSVDAVHGCQALDRDLVANVEHPMPPGVVHATPARRTAHASDRTTSRRPNIDG